MDIQDLIYLGITIISSLFALFMFFRKPQEKSEITDAVMDQRFQSLDKEFANLRDNHLHTIEIKLDAHIQNQGVRNEEFSNGLVKITTILEERLPKK